ncbi:hypothetical protein KC19_4G188800 [Ceratodon purpureus]|uniref:NB-ARC domain-containing protein n=1 Tax=Ceratodon purpureus TaxID=3225 RepID=A0A8T0IDT8_CERPU|nr:hypothetical protein KC19_4G188800 [Ceratodon purpureus]KAG0580638.1 hypothetical protein KC19_4G188800 [Ceratodon purpureus]KAG0580639.1 hypothetical protein KC19_4G188800 [Ceratodon purpureus]
MRFSTSMYATTLLEVKGMEVDNLEWAPGITSTSMMLGLVSNSSFTIISCLIFIPLLLGGMGTWYRCHGQNASNCENNAKKIGDTTIYEFHKPEGQPKVEIVFIHGLQVGDYQNAYWKTWCTRDRSQCWPQTWLKTKFENDAWILSVCYDSSALNTYESGNTNSKAMGEKILGDMIRAGIGQGGCPIVFVCHSLGGLIVKEVVLRASKESGDEYRKFLNNIRAFFFYGTPHSGSNLHNFMIVRFLRSILNIFSVIGGVFGIPSESSMVKFLEVFDVERTKLNSKFITLRNECHGHWKLFVVAEGAKTKFLWVVPIASAKVGVEEDEFYVSTGVNHQDICKPKDGQDGGYRRLVQCIETVLKEEEDRQENLKAEAERRKRRLEEIPIELLHVKPVGIEKKVQKIEKHLKDFSIVGLVGMGGAGKSTLSLQTFNSMKKDFKKSCFVDVERKHAQDVSSVLKKLRRELCNCRTEGGNMTDEDLSEIKNCLKSESESVLVVLDDVKKPLLDFKVFEELGSKCKLVVTTRDQTHLQVFVNDNKAILEKVIGIKEDGFDKELFYSYAFHGIESDHEKTTCKEIGDKIVERCGGLPLSLKVIGQTVAQYNGEPLYQRVGFWKDIYEKLCDADEGDDNNKLWSRLEISYNSLGANEKELFLDCACMRRNEDWIDMVSAYGNVYGPSTVRTLENRFLISIDRVVKLFSLDNPVVHPRVVMHEQLRDMGRRIAKRANIEYKSFSNEDISELGNPDFKTLRVLSLEKINADLSTASFLKSCLPECFSEVKYLRFDKCNLSLVEHCLTRCSPKKLSWLFIGGRDSRDEDQSIRSLIDKLRPFCQMRVLQLFSLMITGIPQSIGNLKYLKMLEIHCGLLKDLPEEIGHLQELRRLDLSKCFGLLNISSGVGNLSKLEYLNLSSCRALQSLCDFEVGMDSLQELILYRTGCSRRELDVELKGLANLRRLQTLDLRGSSFRKCNLPGCLEILSQLRRLFITECEKDLLQEAAEAFRSPEFQSAAFIQLHLDIIPETRLPSCPNLIGLRLKNTLKLQEWPDLFLDMPKLQFLYLHSEDCYNKWRELPRSFGALVHLKELDLVGFQNLEEFPESIKNLTQLEEFRIDGFPNLLRLPVCLKSFEHLRWVWIEECPSIKWEESGQKALRDMPSLHIR